MFRGRGFAWGLAVGVVIAASVGVSVQGGEETPWELVEVDAGRIAVPRGWLNLDSIKPPVFRQGGGMGPVPPWDETGSPLQVGISVEQHPETTESVEEIVVALVEAAKLQPDLELVGHAVEALELADGTQASLLRAEFLKEGERRSLQMKLVAKGADATAWVVTGHVVGGAESTWPAPDSTLAIWLAAHMTSFTLDGTKFDEAGVRAAYQP